MNKKPWFLDNDVIIFAITFVSCVVIIALIAYVELWLK